jgi:carbonic anhydrase/acetyltransferase-like protein (isoleucine patch superfamily)
VGENASIWYGAVLRGDISPIKVGKKSVIQDLVTVTPLVGKSIEIGDNVLVASNASVESCTIENNCFVGMGSTVRHGARVQSNSVVAAGAVIPEDTKVGSNQIWAGNPAQYLRDLTPEELQVVQEHHDETVELARIHSEQTELSFREIID